MEICSKSHQEETKTAGKKNIYIKIRIQHLLADQTCLAGSYPTLARDLGRLPQQELFQGPPSTGSVHPQSQQHYLWQQIRHDDIFGKTLQPWTCILWVVQDKTSYAWCAKSFLEIDESLPARQAQEGKERMLVLCSPEAFQLWLLQDTRVPFAQRERHQTEGRV